MEEEEQNKNNDSNSNSLQNSSKIVSQIKQPLLAFEDDYFFSVIVLQARFDLPKCYKIQQPLGRGGYGVVVKAIDQRNNERVAIKKILKPFQNVMETRRILREIKILRALEHDSIISIKNVLNPLPKNQLDEIYIVSELMDTDLHQIIASEQKLTEEHIQFFMYQILCALKYIHSAGVFHRDLKPSNILVNQNCEIKICDFGLARAIGTGQSELYAMTEYVATRWYRSPELLLFWKSYNFAIDIWAAGCILAELYLRRPLLPGNCYLNQLMLILNLLGTPSEDDLVNVQSEKAKVYIRSIEKKLPQDFKQIFPMASPQGLDLMQQMLIFNPDKRITAEAALQHPYFANIRDPDYEIKANFQVDFTFEQNQVTVEQLKDQIFEEIKKTNPDFNENDPGTYHIPSIQDNQLYTLDTNGSLIYIDYEASLNPTKQLFKMIQKESYKKQTDLIQNQIQSDQNLIREQYNQNSLQKQKSSFQVKQQSNKYIQEEVVSKSMDQLDCNVSDQQHDHDIVEESQEYQQHNQEQKCNEATTKFSYQEIQVDKYLQ